MTGPRRSLVAAVDRTGGRVLGSSRRVIRGVPCVLLGGGRLARRRRAHRREGRRGRRLRRHPEVLRQSAANLRQADEAIELLLEQLRPLLHALAPVAHRDVVPAEEAARGELAQRAGLVVAQLLQSAEKDAPRAEVRVEELGEAGAVGGQGGEHIACLCLELGIVHIRLPCLRPRRSGQWRERGGPQHFEMFDCLADTRRARS